MIIVTGGSGFIGSNLIAALCDKGIDDKVVLCDVFDHADKWKNIAKHAVYDIITPQNLFNYIGQDHNKKQIRAIYHLGAISSTTETDVDKIIENNIRLSVDLFEWCGRNRVRFIYASSAATYGDGKTGFLDDDHPEYLKKLRPLNPYGWSKHLFDQIVVKRRLQENKDWPFPLQCVGLKFFNVYGANEYHKGRQMSMVATLYHQIIENNHARLFKSYDPKYPDGGQLRDFVYVEDCISVMLWLLENQQVNGLLNVGTGKSRSFYDLAKAVFKAMNKPESIEFIDMPDQLQKQYQYFTQADVTKLNHESYPYSFHELEDGVAHYVQNYLSQPDPYR